MGKNINLELKKELPAWVIRDLLTRQDNGSVESEFRSLSEDYAAFKRSVKRYVRDPQNITYVHYFLNQHPMFWWYEYGNVSEKESFYIQTEDGWNSILLLIARSKKTAGKKVIRLETGAADEGKKIFFHDLKLDVAADSLEAAYIKLAAKIYARYDEHGDLRSGQSQPNSSDGILTTWDKVKNSDRNTES
jgi:hypothetical protein